MSAPLAIAWFRQDLRISDNPALIAAADFGDVVPVYILDDANAGDKAMGAASRVWLHHSLAELNRALDGRLLLLRGDARSIMGQLVDRLEPGAVFWNRCYEPWRIRRDTDIRRDLNERGIENRSYNASLLWEPWEVARKNGAPYRVFTPFYQKGCRAAPAPRQPLPAPGQLSLAITDNDVEGLPCHSLDELELLPRTYRWHESICSHWRVGEISAARRFDDFCADSLAEYRLGRDYPARDATSLLSPHLHFGEISPHQLWHRIEYDLRGDGAEHFQREIAWREFSYHLLYHFPQLPDENFNARFDLFEWRQDSGELALWQRGLTGYPIVDAGMRELWQTGYMHNRVRMIVASFLIKNMLLPWRIGASWFWDCLVDADLASNSASWQWCAGSGADAAPYFRIFNPVLQSEKFDPQGEYLVRFCPELKGLPARYRHKPWLADEAVLQSAGIKLGSDYPEPMLDLKFTRERALERFKALPRT